jgi:RimJ/RimL family protein N-acetyltransferase
MSPPALAPVEIAAGAFQLRPLEPDDAAEVLASLLDPQIRRWFAGTPPTRVAEMGPWIERRLDRLHTGTGLSWTIRTAVGGTFAGTIEVHGLDLQDLVGELGYGIVEGFRRQGVATMAVDVVSRYLFGGLGLHRVQLMHAVENVASCGVADKAGFTYEGTLRETAQLDGVWVDEHMHARLAQDPSPTL